MSINRYNYEEYFLLYVDNELPAAERAAVEKFAREHPDLSQELELLKQSVLRPEPHQVFTNKETLMRSSQGAGFINESNCEEYFILYTDNELSAPDKAAVESYLYHHPEMEEAFQLLQQAKLQPEKIAFPGKDQLYKSEGDRKVAPLRWWKLAAAAMVLFIAGWLWLNNQAVPFRNNSIAAVKEGKDSEKISRKLQETSPAVKQEKSAGMKDMGKAGTATEAGSVRTEKNTVAANAFPPAAKSKNDSGATTDHENRGLKTAQVKLAATTPPGGELLSYQQGLVKINPEGSIKTLQQPGNVLVKEIPEDNNATVTFASGIESDNVILTNIPVHGNMPLRGLRRKASRLIDVVASIKNGSRRGISIGNVEIAIQ